MIIRRQYQTFIEASKGPKLWQSNPKMGIYFTGYILEPGVLTNHGVIHLDIDCIELWHAVPRMAHLISHGYFAMETYDSHASEIIYEYLSTPLFTAVKWVLFS